MFDPQVEQVGDDYFVGKKLVGRIVKGRSGEKDTYFKPFKPSHIYNKRGKATIGIQYEVLQDCQARGIVFVKLRNSGTGSKYIVQLDKWMSKGELMSIAGFGRQLFFPLSMMHKI